MGLSLAHSVAFLRLIQSNKWLCSPCWQFWRASDVSFSGVEWKFLILYGKMRKQRMCVLPLTTCSLNFHLAFIQFLGYMFPWTLQQIFEKKNRWTRFKIEKGQFPAQHVPQLAVLQAVHLQLFQLFLLLFSSKSINNLQNQLQKKRQPIQLQIQVSPLGSWLPHTSLQAAQNIHSLGISGTGLWRRREHHSLALQVTSCHFLSHVIGWIIHKPCQQFCYQLGKRKAKNSWWIMLMRAKIISFLPWCINSI